MTGLSLREAASASGIGYWTLLKAVKSNALPADMPLGRRGGWRIEAEDLAMFLQRRKLRTGNAALREIVKGKLK